MNDANNRTDAADGQSRLTEVLGSTVTFLDDHKGKHMSHEAHISKCSRANGVMGYATLEAVGYGANPDEALNDLRLVVADLMRPNVELRGGPLAARPA